jgi:hypothetical protein
MNEDLLRAEIHRMFAQERDRQIKALAELEIKIERAFMGADFDGHRRWHEKVSELEFDSKNFRKALFSSGLSALIWGLLFMVGGIAIYLFIRGFK